MQQNSILLQELSLEQLTKLITNIVKAESDEIKIHFQLKDPPTFWTRQGVASFLSVDISTVHNYTKKGILKSYGIQGRVYYKRSEVEASLKPLNHWDMEIQDLKTAIQSLLDGLAACNTISVELLIRLLERLLINFN